MKLDADDVLATTRGADVRPEISADKATAGPHGRVLVAASTEDSGGEANEPVDEGPSDIKY